ncbi:hypothetical protein L1049_020392 [Liquidambar formosana]|uniref:DUF4283 domain-containing protein n=1 Tax=Liquidambar formosana TaxID=63359 RepID=A0AAP0S8H5_LIQFO
MASPMDEISQLISQTANLCCDEIFLELPADSESEVNVVYLSLVGKVVPDRVINVHAVKAVLSRAWNLKQGISISCLAPNTFLFGLYDPIEWNRALHSGPWSISGSHLIVKEWSPSLVLEELNLSLSSFWVQAHGLPRDRKSLDNILRIGTLIGKVIVSDNPSIGPLIWRKFVRFKVEFNVWNLLRTSFVVEEKGSLDVWIQFRYERLSNFCYQYGRLSHISKACPYDITVLNSSSSNPCHSPMAFGPWLRADYGDSSDAMLPSGVRSKVVSHHSNSGFSGIKVVRDSQTLVLRVVNPPYSLPVTTFDAIVDVPLALDQQVLSTPPVSRPIGPITSDGINTEYLHHNIIPSPHSHVLSSSPTSQLVSNSLSHSNETILVS